MNAQHEKAMLQLLGVNYKLSAFTNQCQSNLTFLSMHCWLYFSCQFLFQWPIVNAMLMVSCKTCHHAKHL